jgi:hypothetical protein
MLLEGCSPDEDLGTVMTGMTLAATVNTLSGGRLFDAGCSSSRAGRERVIAFNVDRERDVTIAWNQTGDHVFGLFEERGGDCDENPAGCHDPAGMAAGSHTFRRLSPGGYLMIIEANSPGDEGNVTLRLTTS